jgi:hypothetical protein
VGEDGGRGPGRPKGAKNRNTRDVIAYHESLGYRSPLITLAELGSGASLEEIALRARWLAAQLGCKAVEAMRIIVDAANAYAPYRHSRMPIAMDVQAKSAKLVLNLDLGKGAVAAGGDGVMQLLDAGAREAIAAGFQDADLQLPAEVLAEGESDDNSDG